MSEKTTRTTGFPSPAENEIEAPIDLAKYLDLSNPAKKTVILPESSYPEKGILAGDVLIVDTSKPPIDDRLVVANYMGKDVLGLLKKKQNRWFLYLSDDSEPIPIEEGCDIDVLGLVVSMVREEP